MSTALSTGAKIKNHETNKLKQQCFVRLMYLQGMSVKKYACFMEFIGDEKLEKY